MKVTWKGQMPVDLANQEMKMPRSKSEIWGLEHPTTVTLGLRGSEDLDLNGGFFGASKVPLVRVDRGGQATLHSPGQLVIYPLLNLREYTLRPKAYMTMLMDATQVCLKDLGLIAHQIAGCPGLFSKKGKLVFVGVRIQSGWTRHGIAINIGNDLNLFQMIRPCGRSNEPIDRLFDHGLQITPEQLFQRWALTFLNLLTPKGLDSNLNPTFTSEMRA